MNITYYYLIEILNFNEVLLLFFDWYSLTELCQSCFFLTEFAPFEELIFQEKQPWRIGLQPHQVAGVIAGCFAGYPRNTLAFASLTNAGESYWRAQGAKRRRTGKGAWKI